MAEKLVHEGIYAVCRPHRISFESYKLCAYLCVCQMRFDQTVCLSADSVFLDVQISIHCNKHNFEKSILAPSTRKPNGNLISINFMCVYGIFIYMNPNEYNQLRNEQ